VRVICLILVLVTVPSLASANFGVPMLAVVWPTMFISLIPIIIIEALYMRRKLQIALKKAFKVMAIANLLSTMIGIPFTWGVLFLAELVLGVSTARLLGAGELPPKALRIVEAVFSVTIGAAWLGPEEASRWDWLAPSAATVLLLPFFFVTWWLERASVERQMPDFEGRVVGDAVMRANIITYGLLAIASVAWLLVAIATEYLIG